ncbi:hypothetical protein SMICM17S_05672 [Streptomyces microflavus]
MRLALAHQPGRPVPLNLGDPSAHRRWIDSELGGLCWIPVHQRHPWRIVRPRLTLQSQLGRTQLKAGANLLHMPEPKGERVVLRTLDIAQQRRGRGLRGQGIHQELGGGVGQQHYQQVDLPPRGAALCRHLLKEDAAALDLRDRELLTVISEWR